MHIKHHIEPLPKGLAFKMIEVVGDSFKMGGSDGEALNREKPIHEVSVQSFYIGEFPVTQELWQAVMNNNPSNFKELKRPVEQVSWNDTQDFLKKLNEVTGKDYRLPTEAEWEFAARGGIHSEEYIYAGSDRLTEVGWYRENSGRETHPVGKKSANELGIYDMSGNVWEWVEDQWHDDYQDAPTDGSAWVDADQGAYRVCRGGSWLRNARYCRVSFRDFNSPGFRGNSLGFRLALSLQSVG